MRRLTLILLVLGCGRIEVRPPTSPAAAPRRAELAAVYGQRLAEFTPDDGFPSTTDCDTGVWAGVACLGGVQVAISKLEYPAGTLNRRPAPACWVPEKAGEQQPSASTASGDTATLYAACAFKQRDRGALERLLAYAAANGNYIGLPHTLDLTYLEPSLKATIEHAVQDLGGAPAAKAPIVELPPGKDYQVHIVTEAVDFAVAATGGVSGWELAIMEALAKVATPNDALVQAELAVFTRDFRKAEDLLLGPAATTCPSYVRGDRADLFCKAWWLRAAKIVLEHTS